MANQHRVLVTVANQNRVLVTVTIGHVAFAAQALHVFGAKAETKCTKMSVVISVIARLK